MVRDCALARRVRLSSLAALAGEIILNGGQRAYMRRAIDKANGKLVVLVIVTGSHFSVAFLAHL